MKCPLNRLRGSTGAPLRIWAFSAYFQCLMKVLSTEMIFQFKLKDVLEEILEEKLEEKEEALLK